MGQSHNVVEPSRIVRKEESPLTQEQIDALPPSALLIGEEVCTWLKISDRTLSRWTASRSIKYIRLSRGNYRFRKSDVEEFLQRRTVSSVKKAA
jgi:excisionase family DNA binding protein